MYKCLRNVKIGKENKLKGDILDIEDKEALEILLDSKLVEEVKEGDEENVEEEKEEAEEEVDSDEKSINEEIAVLEKELEEERNLFKQNGIKKKIRLLKEKLPKGE